MGGLRPPDRCNTVSPLAVFNGELYAGVASYSGAGSQLKPSPNTHPGGRVYRYAGGKNWVDCGRVCDAEVVWGMTVFQGKLFATAMDLPPTKRRAFAFNLLSGSSSVAGGVVGYFVLDAIDHLLPYALLLAAASFIYIALSDLLPEMMRRSRLAQSLPQAGLVLVGVALAAAIGAAMHAH